MQQNINIDRINKEDLENMTAMRVQFIYFNSYLVQNIAAISESKKVKSAKRNIQSVILDAQS